MENIAFQTDWLYGLIGGLFIGLGGAVFLLGNGRIMGASGLIGGLVDGSGWSNAAERIVFLAGVVIMPIIVLQFWDVAKRTSQTMSFNLSPRVFWLCRNTHRKWMYIGSRCVRYISSILAWDRCDSLLYYGGRPDHGAIPCSVGVDLMKLVIALIAGMLFGGGLVVSGMTDTAKVQGWLDVFGAWDPTLAFVMGVQ